MKKLTAEERKSRIISRGEFTGHCHVIIGDAVVRNENGEILIDVKGEASIRHLIESAWLSGVEIWTKDHNDINLSAFPSQVRHGDVLLDKIGENTYKYIQQMEKDPYEDVIRKLKD